MKPPEEHYPYRKSAHLHNFKKMPTPWLSWGTHKILRCAKFHALNSSADDHQSNSIDFDFKHIRTPIPKLIIKKNKSFVGTGIVKDERIGFGIDAVREKLTADLKNEAANMKLEILKQRNYNNEQEEEEEEEEDIEVEYSLPAATAAVVEEKAVERPWNLRTRRAACKAPVILNEKAAIASVSPLKTEISWMKSSRLRSSGCNGGEKIMEARAKFSAALSKREIEEDYLMMIGAKPPRRPKKRPKTVQKQLDTLFPGLWLSEVTPEMYKVQEFSDPQKK